MAKRLQHRGGTTSQHSTFTGAVREVTVDTDKNTLVVHDGATAGGHPLATATNFTSTGIDDNATSTAITINSSQNVDIVGTTTSSNFIADGTGYAIKMYFNGTATLNNNSNAVIFTGAGASGDYLAGTLNLQSRGDGTARDINLITGATPSKTLTAHGNGDVSFYEDTGTTPKMFWDASAESLELGTSSGMNPTATLVINEASNGTPAIEVVPTTDNTNGVTANIRLWGSAYGVANRYSEIKNITDGSTASNELAFDTNGTERMRITSDGFVGIGTSTPSTTLDVVGDGSNNLPIKYFRGTSGASGYLYSDGGGSGIVGGDGNLNNTGMYLVTDTRIDFRVNGSERMRIDSSGRLLVGTTNTSAIAQSGNSMTYDNGRLEVQKYRTPALKVGNYTDAFGAYSGNLVEFYSGGTTVGSIGVTSLRTFVGTGDTGLLFNDIYDSIDPWDTSTNSARDNNIDLGDATRRYKDLYLGGGLYVGGTAAANKLDDYEEGTWTPVLVNNTTTTYSNQTGWYRKIGNTVYIYFSLSLSNKGDISGSYTRIGGLPFNGSPNTRFGSGQIHAYRVGSSIHIQGIEFGGSVASVGWIMTGGGTQTGYLNTSYVVDNSFFEGFAMYRTA